MLLDEMQVRNYTGFEKKITLIKPFHGLDIHKVVVFTYSSIGEESQSAQFIKEIS